MRCESTNMIILKSSFIFMIISMMTVIFCSENCFAEGTIASGAMNYAVEHSINSVIYDNYKYGADGEKGLALTSNGITYNNWEYTDSKYLQVTMMVEAKRDEVHILEIKLDKLFYSVSDVTRVPSGFSKVEIVKNPDISTNGGRNTYTLNKGSVTLRYYLKPNMTRATIRLELRYDPIIWDKLGNSPLTPEGVSPIIVSLGHEKSSDNYLLGQYSSMVHVAKATSGKGIFGDGDVYLKRNMNTSSWDAKHSYFGYKDDPFRLWIYLAEDNKQCIDRYLKRVIIDIDVPYYERDGKKYYLDYDVNSLGFEGTKNGFINGTVTKATESHISFYVDGLYTEDNRRAELDLKWPSELTTDEDSVVFNMGGKISYKVITNANTEIEAFAYSIGKIELATRLYEKVRVYDESQSITIKKMPSKTVTRLGTVYLKNDGTCPSTRKNINIEFNRKHLVTSMRIPADTVTEKFNIRYTLKNSYGSMVTINGENSWTITLDNSFYNTDSIDNLNVLIKRSLLPEDQKKYYFNTISYDLGTIKERTRLYLESNDKIAYSKCTGIIYGKLANDVMVGEKLNGTLIITSPQGSGIKKYKKSIKSTVVAEEKASYGVINAKFSKSEITAGDEVYTTGDLWVSDYYYRASSTWLHNIRFALLLPNGVSIDKDSIDVRTSKNDNVVSVVNVITKKIDDDNTLWIIDLDKDVYIGYFTEGLGQNSTNGKSLKYSIKLKTDYKMGEMALHTDRMVFLAPINQPNVIDCCRKSYKVKDKYDINGDGRTDDIIGRSIVADRESCSIAPYKLALDIDDSISVIGKGTVEGRKAIINSRGDIVKYDLNIASRNDGTASSFAYYIPIIKNNLLSDGFLIENQKDVAFNMELVEEASTTGDDIYIFEYTTRKGVSYKQARTLPESEWFTSSEMGARHLSYSDVTLMRITVRGGKIDKGMDTTISIKMKYQGVNADADRGKINAWRGCGYYDFDDGIKVVSGHFPTGGVSATVDITEPPKNKLKVYNGDPNGVHNGDPTMTEVLFYIYDVVGYNDIARPEPIEFMVERDSDSDVVTLAISKSDNYSDTSSYLNKGLARIYDENKCIVEPNSNNVYNLKANKKYKIVMDKRNFLGGKKSKYNFYLHSYNPELSDVETLNFVRASAFVQN